MITLCSFCKNCTDILLPAPSILYHQHWMQHRTEHTIIEQQYRIGIRAHNDTNGFSLHSLLKVLLKVCICYFFFFFSKLVLYIIKHNMLSVLGFTVFCFFLPFIILRNECLLFILTDNTSRVQSSIATKSYYPLATSLGKKEEKKKKGKSSISYNYYHKIFINIHLP